MVIEISIKTAVF